MRLYGKKRAIERAGTLVGMLEGITGLSETKIMQSREFPCPHLRAMVMERLIEEGALQTDAGLALGKSHSTVIFWLKTLSDQRRMGFIGLDDIREIYDNFRRALSSDAPRDDGEPSLTPEAAEVLKIAFSVLHARRTSGYLARNEYEIITQTITNKINQNGRQNC